MVSCASLIERCATIWGMNVKARIITGKPNVNNQNDGFRSMLTISYLMTRPVLRMFMSSLRSSHSPRVQDARR